jgi:hypothetical protein
MSNPVTHKYVASSIKEMRKRPDWRVLLDTLAARLDSKGVHLQYSLKEFRAATEEKKTGDTVGGMAYFGVEEYPEHTMIVIWNSREPVHISLFDNQSPAIVIHHE